MAFEPPCAGVRRGGAALQLRQRVLERRALGLVAERVDVGDVVGRDVQHGLVDLEAADGRVHAPHHGCICSLCSAASSRRSGRSWVVAVAPLGDDGAVDVGEDLLLHVVAIDRGDDRPVAGRRRRRRWRRRRRPTRGRPWRPRGPRRRRGARASPGSMSMPRRSTRCSACAENLTGCDCVAPRTLANDGPDRPPERSPARCGRPARGRAAAARGCARRGSSHRGDRRRVDADLAADAQRRRAVSLDLEAVDRAGGGAAVGLRVGHVVAEEADVLRQAHAVGELLRSRSPGS